MFQGLNIARGRVTAKRISYVIFAPSLSSAVSGPYRDRSYEVRADPVRESSSYAYSLGMAMRALADDRGYTGASPYSSRFRRVLLTACWPATLVSR